MRPQISTTKGTGGDVIILEEAAYIDSNFFYVTPRRPSLCPLHDLVVVLLAHVHEPARAAQETVAPLLSMGNTTLLAISTLTSEINFYTRLIKMRDPVTHQPIFTILSVQLACAACKAEGRAAQCVHMLHLVPRWQSADRHMKLKIIMQDRPDLIESELSGLAFDSLQQVFKPELLEIMINQPCPVGPVNEDIHIFIDPAAGGPYSDYAVLSVTRLKGLITVRPDVPPRAPVGPLRREGVVARHERVVRGADGAAPPLRARAAAHHQHGRRDPGELVHGAARRVGDLYSRPNAQLIRYAMRARSTASSSVTVSSLTHAGSSSSCRVS